MAGLVSHLDEQTWNLHGKAVSAARERSGAWSPASKPYKRGRNEAAGFQALHRRPSPPPFQEVRRHEQHLSRTQMMFWLRPEHFALTDLCPVPAFLRVRPRPDRRRLSAKR